MKSLDKRLLRMLLKTKAQFAAVSVVLAVGVLSFVALNFSARNLEISVAQYYEMTGFADIFCEVMRIPQYKVEDLAKISGVEAVAGRVVKEVSFDNGSDKQTTVRLISYDKTAEINDVYIRKGQLLSGDDEIMLAKLFAEALNIDVGDDFTVIVGGRRRTLKVSAIVSNPEYIYLVKDEQDFLPDPALFGVGYVSENFAQKQFGFNRSYNHLYFRTARAADQTDILNRLEKKLDNYGIIKLNQRDSQISARMTSEEIVQNKKTANVIPFVFICVAALIIGVMLNRLVKGDRMAIGVMKAIGYDNRAIISHYTKYGFLIGLSGSLIGLGLGILLAFQLVKLYMDFYDIPLMTERVFPGIMLLGITLACTFCILAGLYGARGIIKIDPAESMRPAAPKIGKRIWLERMPFLWRRLSFSWKVVVRNMLRSKKRMAFIIFGVALTYAVVLMPIYTIDSFLEMFERQYGAMYKMDYTVKFTRGVDDAVIAELKRLTAAERVEAQIEFPFELIYGWKKKSVSIIGIDPQTRLYRFKDLQKEPLIIPDSGIVLTEGLARLLSVGEGDSLKVSSFLPNRDDVTMPVTAIVNQSLGLNAYMNIDFMQRELLEKNFINAAIIAKKQIDTTIFDDMKNVKTVQSLEDMKAIFRKFTKLALTTYSAMIVLGGILGFAIIYNATVMSINERQLEFSSMRVMGFDKIAIFRIVVREDIVLSIIGIILGIPIGKKLVDGVAQTFSNELYTLEMVDDPMLYAYTALAVAFFVFIAQVATYNKIYHLNFMDALKARMT